MRNNRFAKTSAYLLLAIFTTMIFFSDFHCHKVVFPMDACTMCEHNIPHPQHISQFYSHQDICLLCQWTNEAFSMPLPIMVVAFLAIITTLYCNIALKRLVRFYYHKSSRSPPVF